MAGWETLLGLETFLTEASIACGHVEGTSPAAYLQADFVQSRLRDAYREVRSAYPHTQCPFYPACEQGECKACNGRCWLNKARYDLVPEPIRRRHEARRDEQ